MSAPRFLLLANVFSDRAESVQFMALAEELRDVHSVHSVISFPQNATDNSQQRIREAQSRGLRVVPYASRAELERIAERESTSHTFVMSDGTKGGPWHSRENPGDFRIAGNVHITHAVFRNFEPVGDFYLYVSDWLLDWAFWKAKRRRRRKSETANPVIISALPHGLPQLEGTGRSARVGLGIAPEAFVIGRVGGPKEFSDPVARKAILTVLSQVPNSYFLAVNTESFTSHPRVFYIPRIGRSEIKDFYDSCDLLINGRLVGETFGFSIVEPLSLGKPVLAPHWLRNPRMDRNHIRLLADQSLLYVSKRGLVRKILRIQRAITEAPDYTQKVRDYTVSNMAMRLMVVATSRTPEEFAQRYDFPSWVSPSDL